MAIRSQFKMRIAQRRVRHFSGTIKIQQVREIESGQTKILEIVKEYEVASITVYRWMKKFGTMKRNLRGSPLNRMAIPVSYLRSKIKKTARDHGRRRSVIPKKC